MHQCYSQIQMYEDLIYGELEPIRLNGENNNLGAKYLEMDFGRCQNMQLIKLKIKKQDEEVIEKLSISNAHPLANKYFLQRDLDFNNSIEELLSNKLIKKLDLNFDEVLFTVSETKNNIQSIGICKKASWEELNNDRIKYCYYYQVLAECKKNLKRTLHRLVFELDEIQFKKLIGNIQKTLVYYIKELKKLHDINPKSINYQIKKSYTDQDCNSLIYISLIEVLNFLYENYEEEFNKTFEVPYYSEKINRNKIDEKIKVVQKHLKEQNIDPMLRKILDEQFDRIIRFDHPNRLTYHELDYFTKLLTRLSKHLIFFKNSSITIDDIISILISFKFNNFKFTQYVTNEIRKDLSSITDLNEKRLHLLTQKKNVNQCLKVHSMVYDPQAKDVSTLLRKWIDYELKIVEECIENKQYEKDENQQETLKLDISLSNRELSVFIKTLSDCDIILSKSQTNLARWICANFRNKNGEKISINQARNHLYNKDPLVLDKVKEIAIGIVNVINERLSAKD